MEMRVPNVFARQCLTLLNVLEQLKYRYDLEIDRCQRSALKRIIEQVFNHIFPSSKIILFTFVFLG